MLKISNAVRQLAENDLELKTPLKEGLINLSAYAKKIKARVEELTKKKVESRSIVVALSRFVKALPPLPQEKELKILRMSVYADLEEISYEKTKENLKKLEEVYRRQLRSEQNFFALTQSLTEITMVGDKESLATIKKNFGAHDLFHKKNLSGISLKFPLSYLSRPNVIYNFIKKIAIKRINLIEIISSSSELTIVVENKDAAETVKQLTPAAD